MSNKEREETFDVTKFENVNGLLANPNFYVAISNHLNSKLMQIPAICRLEKTRVISSRHDNEGNSEFDQVVDALRVVWHNADCADLMDDASDLMKSIVLNHEQVPPAKAVAILTEYQHEDTFDAESSDGKTVLRALDQLSAKMTPVFSVFRQKA